MLEPDVHQTAAKVAKLLAFHGVRNSALEDLHAGTFPSSEIGDFSDVKVVSPYGEIPWNQVGRISDDEMKPLMEDIVNRLYTFLFHLLTSGEPDRGMPLPKNWSPPQIEDAIAGMWTAAGHPGDGVCRLRHCGAGGRQRKGGRIDTRGDGKNPADAHRGHGERLPQAGQYPCVQCQEVPAGKRTYQW